MTLSESPFSPRRSLNLVTPICDITSHKEKLLNNVPEKHPSFRGIPFCYVVEVPSHGRLEHVALGAIERGYGLDVVEKALSAP